MTERQIDKVTNEAIVLAEALARAIPRNTSLVGVITAASALIVFTAKSAGMDKFTTQKLLVATWDATGDPNDLSVKSHLS